MASTGAIRSWYSLWRCNNIGLVWDHRFNGANSGPIRPETVEIWDAMAQVLAATGRRTDSAWCYVCRGIGNATCQPNGTGCSLHAYPGIARDENPLEGPFRNTPSLRRIRYSGKLTQDGRARDVARGVADTTLTPRQVELIKAIRFNAAPSTPALGWGGDWITVKDAMHWQIQHPWAVLVSGVDWSTVFGGGLDMARYFKQGDEGEHVREVQAMLKYGLGYDLGNFGPDGDGVDGQAGGATFTAILSERAEARQNGWVIEEDIDYCSPKDLAHMTQRVGSGASKDSFARKLARDAQDAADGAQATADAAEVSASGAQATADQATQTALTGRRRANQAHRRLDRIVIPGDPEASDTDGS